MMGNTIFGGKMSKKFVNLGKVLMIYFYYSGNTSTLKLFQNEKI